MKKAQGLLVLIILLIIGFAIELVTGSAGNEAALLKLGGLPDNGALHDDTGVLQRTRFCTSTGCTSL